MINVCCSYKNSETFYTSYIMVLCVFQISPNMQNGLLKSKELQMSFELFCSVLRFLHCFMVVIIADTTAVEM